MVCMGVGIDLTRDGSDDVVLLGHTRESKVVGSGGCR